MFLIGLIVKINSNRYTIIKILEEQICIKTVKMTVHSFHYLYSERRVLKEADYPLLERVLLGPIENEAKIFIMEKDKTHEVSSEVN